MRFLRMLFWLLLGGIVAAFVIYNGDERVSIHLWAGLIADFSLPFLLILVFVAGALPALLAYYSLRWRTRQRISGLERALADLHSVNATPLDDEPEALPAPLAADTP